MMDFFEPIDPFPVAIHCGPGKSTVHKCKEENTYFPGPLMSNKMQREQLIKFIQGKVEECLQQNAVEEYFFWLIMELFCHKNGVVMMFEVAVLFFKGYCLFNNKPVNNRDVKVFKEWCLSLARLLSSDTPEDEQREAVIKMGDDLASKQMIFAAHICYVVANLELGSRSQFQLIGCASMPFGTAILSDAIERTETYEYVLSLTSGQAQPSFQIFKLCHASRLIIGELYQEAVNYCEVICRAVFTFPDKITRSFVERLILVACGGQYFLGEEPEWLLELNEFHSTILAGADCCTNSLFDIERSEGSPKAVESSCPSLQATDKKQPLAVKGEFYSRYKKGRLLGQGGFGSVYSGIRIADKKKVAIKYIFKGDKFKFVTIPGEQQELPLEVALMKMASKPPYCRNVLQLLEWFDMGDTIILILERPDPCVDLWKFTLRQKGSLSEAQTRDIMVQVVRAARHCFDRGVFHRDIKPENLLINPNTMEVKLIDFGCGELMKDEDYVYTRYTGTKTYIPPEFTVLEEYTAIPTTIWGLGILMVRLLSGKCPFSSLQDLQEGHLNLPSDLSQECFELIMWCLEIVPETRPTFDDLVRHEWFTGDKFRTRLHHNSEHSHRLNRPK